ncbi:hypothetical protein KKF55_04515 [Patescibacteria group bacterium]|nr:hypothetical protein [Patescibacteria group bacterium]
MNLLFTIVGFLVEKAHAASGFSGYCGILHPSDCDAGSAAVVLFAAQVGNFFAIFIAGGAVIAIIYGAIKLIISGGNDQGKEDAKKIITAAVIGLILAIAAEAIILFVVNFVSTI